jgi:hypothetical protein
VPYRSIVTNGVFDAPDDRVLFDIGNDGQPRRQVAAARPVPDRAVGSASMSVTSYSFARKQDRSKADVVLPAPPLGDTNGIIGMLLLFRDSLAAG